MSQVFVARDCENGTHQYAIFSKRPKKLKRAGKICFENAHKGVRVEVPNLIGIQLCDGELVVGELVVINTDCLATEII